MRFIPIRTPLAALLAAVLVTAGAPADEAIITLNDGRVLDGQLVRQDAQSVVIAIAGIERSVARREIASITVGETVADVYQQKKRELPPDSADAWLELIRYLIGRQQHDLAAQELRSLLAAHPQHRAAEQVLVALASREQAPAESPPAPSDPGQEQPAATGPRQPHLLTDEQVNLIRLWELPADLGRAEARIRVPREVVDTLFANYAGQANIPDDPRGQGAYRRKPAHEQLTSIFRLRARELYPQVEVLQDPAPLDFFRRQINPNYVVRYFHRHFGDGAVPGLDLDLVAVRPNGVHEAYTNFYRLTNARHNGMALLDRNNPERSLLLQWGLPRDVALAPAPEVPGWRAQFTGTGDPTYQRYVRWIDSLYSPNPDYGIEPESEPEPAPAPDAADAEPAD